MEHLAKKVLLDGRMLAGRNTGTGRYVTQVAKNLSALNQMQVGLELICMNEDVPPVEIKSVIRIDKRPQTVWQQIRPPVQLNDMDFDIYHYPSIDPPRLNGRKMVVTCHDIEPLVMPQLFSRRIVYFYKAMIRRLRSAAKIIVVSANTARDVEKILGIDPETIAVISHGVESHFHPVSRSHCNNIAAVYDLPEKYILYVGNTMPHKNLPRLIQAFARVRRNHPDLHLLLAGAKDKYRPQVEAAISSSGLDNAVRFLGKVPDSDLPAIYSCAGVFAFPSLYEGFGLPVLEAMACGTPVVASAAASLPEVTGDAAILVDPLDVTAIADGITRVLEDEDIATSYSVKGMQRASMFSWHKCAEEHLAVYRELLGLS